MGVASGILLVRTLSQTEYAFFTLGFSMLSTMSILADSGIGIALSSIGGRVWQDRERFGQLINTALRLRRYLAAIAVVVVTPISVWLLIRSGASPVYAAGITLTLLAGLNYQLLSGVLMIVPRLHSQIKRVQTLDALAAAVRLAVVVAAYFIFLNAEVAILATIVSVIVQYVLLRRWVKGDVNLAAPVSREDQAAMLGIVKHQAPNAVFFCLQGQLTVWLISIFGRTQNIAEVGALGRLGMIFSVIGAVMTSIVLPAFARCQSPRELRIRYFQVCGAFLLLGLSLITAAAVFPDQFLWILGSKYAHLKHELLLMMIMAAVNSLVSTMWSLNSTKARIKYSWLNIPGVVLTQIVLLTLLDVSTVHGVILFGIFSLLPTFLLNSALTFRGLSEPRLSTG
ncbi:MAG TPA: polysaccharide biosynthesis protein [Blastocatellia bacterium]|nr:polysaccharide biosynthesis protein [Blastocatellia bacterium]